MAMYYSVAIFMSFLSFCFGQNATYFITMPNMLKIEESHKFYIQTSTSIVLKIISIHPESQLKHEGSIYMIDPSSEYIPYQVPFVGQNIGSKIVLKFIGDKCLNADCLSKKEVFGNFVNETVDIELLDKNFIIFAETDKPMYKPGDKIKFRFLPIYSGNLKRQPELLDKQWEIIIDNKGNFSLVEFNEEDNYQKFDLITIENPQGVRMAQWKNVSVEDSMNLEYQLNEDPVFGTWKSKAIFYGQVEVIEFKIMKYVLPRFTVDINPPSEILAGDKIIKFEICAKYSTGKSMTAQIAGKLCIIFQANKMRCQTFSYLLNKELCTKIKLKSEDVFPLDKNRYVNSKTLINVTVTENGTTSAVSKSVTVDGIKYISYNIKLDSQSYFKPGLPYHGKIKLLRNNKKPKVNATVTLNIEERYSRSTWGFQKNYTSDKNGIIEFIIPYIPVSKKISLQVVTTEKIKPPLSPANVYEVLNPWESTNNHYLQILPIQSPTRCPGILNLTILTNVDVSSITMYAQIFSRGTITKFKEFPPVPVKCYPRDDYIGHYNCHDSQNSILCLPGWKGDNCREPICDGGCENGACVNRNQCVCKNGWKGENCNICIRPPYCKNGYCKNGNDCVCLPGWKGYNCATKGPKVYRYENITTPSVTTVKKESPREFEKQTIYERFIDLPLMKDMGPDVHIIVYFISQDAEVVADSLEIFKGLKNCSNLGGGKFRFSKQTAVPKSKVSLAVNPGIKNSSCAVRIADVALAQFDKSSQVDLGSLVDRLITLSHKITGNNQNRVTGRKLCVPNNRVKRMIWTGRNLGYDSRTILSMAGFTAITNAKLVHTKCLYGRYSTAVGSEPTAQRGFNVQMPMGVFQKRKTDEKEKSKIQKVKSEIKKQIRDFFPETWLFSYYKNFTGELNLTVPDSMTTWKANSYCVTKKGIWIPSSQSLKVIMPFYIDIYVPYSMKLDEELFLPIKIFNNMDACYVIKVQISVNLTEIEVLGVKSFTLCVCSNKDTTVYFRIKPKILGKLNITVEANSKYSSFCSSKNKTKVDIEMFDAIRRHVIVEPQGVPNETVYSTLICNKNEQLGVVSLFKIPDQIVPGSLRSYLTYNGDIMGQTFENLERMVKVPYGCGEQNMVAVVPSIYVLQYLNELKINNPDLTKKAKQYILQGYNRQMTYKHDDGSFSAFGKSDKAGSTWLTAFVLRSFSDASNYVYIDKNMLNEAIKYLEKMQLKSGCFKEDGKLFSSTMAGKTMKSGATDETLLTAYILISLKAVNITKFAFNVSAALKCIESGYFSNASNYQLALTAYTFSLYQPESKLTNSMMSTLLARCIIDGRYRFWRFNEGNNANDKAAAADIETTGYALLALLNSEDPSESLQTVYWLSSQRNSLGGYYSTQDTIVGLNALSSFAKMVGLSSVYSLNVSVVLNKQKSFPDFINSENRLLLRSHSLGSEDISYISVKTNGSGCLSLQVVSLYNTNKYYSAQDTFKLNVKATLLSKKVCTVRLIEVCFAYLRLDKSSNMILVIIDYPTGWQLSDKEIDRLKYTISTPLMRIDFQKNKMELYYEAISYRDANKDFCFQFQLEEKLKVFNIQPALVKLIDYYDPEIYSEQSYHVVDKECDTKDNKTIDIPKLLSCPSCTNYSEEAAIKFLQMICQSSFSGFVNVSSSLTRSRTLYEARYSVFYEWYLDLEPQNCSCLKQWSSINNSFVILSTRWISLSEKLILSNNSVMFPVDILKLVFSSNLRRQCPIANSLYSMMNRILPNLLKNVSKNDSCPTCALQSYVNFNVKNVTSWFCANETIWKLKIISRNKVINGLLTKDNVTLSVEIEFPNKLCYCRAQMMNSDKSFEVIDLKNQIKFLVNSSDKSNKLVLNNEFELIDETLISYYKNIRC